MRAVKSHTGMALPHHDGLYAKPPSPLTRVCKDAKPCHQCPALGPQIAAYVESTFGGVEAARKEILLDFFRHAFDGSGAGETA